MKRLLDFLAPDRSARIAFLSFLAVSPAYFLCGQQHYCIGGHLSDLEDFEVLPYLTDTLWVVGFLISILLAFRTGITFRYVFVFALGVGSLFAFPPGLNSLVGFGIHVTLCALAVCFLCDWID
jgi:hypothetical protein